jgi:hypothetical protein
MTMRFLPDNVTVDNLISSPYGSSSAIGDCSSLNFSVTSMSQLPNETAELKFCNIQPKPTIIPSISIKVADSSSVTANGVRSAARKVGRRRGPLKTKTRENANKVRKLRACAHCRIKKIAVS